MKVFLFSNAKGWKAEHAEQVGATKRDQLIFCNTATPSIYPPYDEHRNKSVYIRWDGDHKRYFKCAQSLKKFKYVFYVGGPKDQIKIHTYGNYPAGYIPSTGFIAYMLNVTVLPITLVNFTGPTAKDNKLYQWYHWKFEQEVYHNDPSVSMIRTV